MARRVSLLLLILRSRTSGAPTGGMLNLKADFDAKGDASCPWEVSVPVCTGTDDYAAIQAAVVEAYRSQQPLLIPSGTYLVNSPILMARPPAPPLSHVLSRTTTGRSALLRRNIGGRGNDIEGMYGPMRIIGDGIHQSVIVAGPRFPKGAAVLSLPNGTSTCKRLLPALACVAHTDGALFDQSPITSSSATSPSRAASALASASTRPWRFTAAISTASA